MVTMRLCKTKIFCKANTAVENNVSYAVLKDRMLPNARLEKLSIKFD